MPWANQNSGLLSVSTKRSAVNIEQVLRDPGAPYPVADKGGSHGWTGQAPGPVAFQQSDRSADHEGNQGVQRQGEAGNNRVT
jgi:hypothetical protein